MASASKLPHDGGLSSVPGRREKLADQIIEALRQDIVTGRLARGSRLPTERELAAHFNASQPTIREAVRALDAMGLVEVRHGSGAFVCGDSAFLLAFALQTVLQLEEVTVTAVLDMAEVLGRESARTAARNATAADIEELARHQAALERVDELPDIDSVIRELEGYHRALSSAAHNPLLFALDFFLISLLLQILFRALSGRGVKAVRERLGAYNADRRAILEAVQARDADGAAEAMNRYLAAKRRDLLRDPEISNMRLSEESAVRVASQMVAAARVASPPPPAPRL